MDAMKLARPSSLSLSRLLLRRFGRNDRAATAIEFGILAPIFFAIVAAAMETALVFFAGQALDSAVHDTSRLIRTGQAHQQAMSAGQYRQAICDRLLNMFDCDQLHISVNEIETFASYARGLPVDPDTGDWTNPEEFDPGQRMSIIVVEAYYKWPTIITIPALMTGVTADGKRLLNATRVFRNEPF